MEEYVEGSISRPCRMQGGIIKDRVTLPGQSLGIIICPFSHNYLFLGLSKWGYRVRRGLAGVGLW